MNLEDLAHRFGYPAGFVALALESLGIPFPGETVLLALAAYAGTSGRLSLVGVIAATAAGGIVGSCLGYLLGHRGGRPLLLRYQKTLHLSQGHLDRAELLFARHGGKAVLLGRWTVLLRTYAGFLAGVSRMNFARFLAFTVAGAVTWASALGVLAYVAGGNWRRLAATLGWVGLLLLLAVAAIAYVWWRRSRK